MTALEAAKRQLEEVTISCDACGAFYMTAKCNTGYGLELCGECSDELEIAIARIR
jgi:hypothetical protein